MSEITLTEESKEENPSEPLPDVATTAEPAQPAEPDDTVETTSPQVATSSTNGALSIEKLEEETSTLVYRTQSPSGTKPYNDKFTQTFFKYMKNLNDTRPTETGTLSIYKRLLYFGRIYWRATVAIGWPIILLPVLLAFNRPEIRCAYIVLVMAVYWVTECIPLPITSLIPLVLFPCFGILSTEQVCICYMNDTIMVFLGGLILAIAIEHSNLHMRIALRTMTIIGCSHHKLLGGLCVVTTFLSMWISNTAATAMMVPIIFAILVELEKQGLCQVFVQGTTLDPEDPTKLEVKPTKVTTAYLLGTAYCATFGGSGTLVGTGTNLTFKGIYETTFPQAESINFSQWMIWATPQMIVNVLLTWLYLVSCYMGLFRPQSEEAQAVKIGREGELIANQVISERYKNLGPMTFQEICISILFVVCIFLWLFKSPGFITGWADVITSVEIKDSTPVILIVILMFLIPKESTFVYGLNRNPNQRPAHAGEGLITWKVIATKMPWGLMFLLGGGFAIAKGSSYSCLSKRIGDTFTPLKHFPRILMITIVCIFTGTITELTTNVGMANIMLPIVAQICVAIEQHPLYLMLPVTLSCSYAFRLPAGTPPNAIVAVSGHMSIKSLVKGGCFPAIYSTIVILILFPTWGVFVYGISEFPEWAKKPQNSTHQHWHCD